MSSLRESRGDPAGVHGSSDRAARKEPQHHPFDWLSTYIQDRGLQRRWQWVTAAYTAVLASLPLVMLTSPNGPDQLLTKTIAVGIGILGLLAAATWLIRWPSREQSSLFLLGASATTAIGCVTLSNPYSALMGCVIFAVLGGFIAYFHTLRYVLVNFAVCTICAAIFAIRLIKDTGDIALATAALMTVAALNIGVPFGIRSLVHTLRTDLRASDHDPLTGLLNRRAFDHAVRALTERRLPGTHLVILMIDLDHFQTAQRLLGTCTRGSRLGRCQRSAAGQLPSRVSDRTDRGRGVRHRRYRSRRETGRACRTRPASNRRHPVPDHGQHRYRQRATRRWANIT